MQQDGSGGRSFDSFEVPGYQEVSPIGRGASSTVYKGYDPELARWVAIKVLLTDDPDDPARKRFKREGEITANLGKHPHIVQVLGTGFTASGSPYVVMEYFEQGSISDRLHSAGAFTVTATLDIGEKIADAVWAAHREGVLHRDIKPQNILLSEYGPALGDFGIARTSANLEWSQSLDQLTPMHAAPEVLMGGASTVQSDLYSLGSTLYTMLCGRAPFAGPPGEAPLRYQVRVMQEAVPPIPRADLPTSVFEVLEQTLAKNPADRFGSAADLRDALGSCRRGQTESHSTGGGPVVAAAVAALIPPPAPPPLPDAADDQPTAMPTSSFLSVPGSEPATVEPGAATTTRSRGPLPRPASDPVPGPVAPEVLEVSSLAHATPLQPLVAPEVPAGTDELTVHRPITTLAPAPAASATEASTRRRTLVIAGVGALAVLLVAGAALLLLDKPTPKTVAVKKVNTITTTTTDQPTNLSLVASGTGAMLAWHDPTGGTIGFLIYQISPTTGPKVAGVTPAGATNFSLPTVNATSTRDCFQVRARINANTVGAPATWCPSGESVTSG